MILIQEEWRDSSERLCPDQVWLSEFVRLGWAHLDQAAAGQSEVVSPHESARARISVAGITHVGLQDGCGQKFVLRSQALVHQRDEVRLIQV